MRRKGTTAFSAREHREMIEFLVLHKEAEGHARLRAELPRVIATGIASTGKKREFLVRQSGRNARRGDA